MKFTGSDTHAGVVARPFVSQRGDRQIPGVVWSPQEDATGPLVLLGHGGSGSVFDGYIVALARGLVRDYGCTCLAIDGPVHGRRRGDRVDNPQLVLLDFSQVWASDDAMTDEMCADWRHVLDEALAELNLGHAVVGYWGLSMGTILGLPLVAADERISAAVLGLAGVIGPTGERLRQDAHALRCPVFFLAQWDDELFSRETVFELFGALGTHDKQLHVTPGSHAEVTSESFNLSARFLMDRLGVNHR